MEANKKTKIFIAMSGGVDSSVAALLLQKDNKYDLVGCFIKGWYPQGMSCAWKEDRRDAMKVCVKLGIPFITVDAEKEYEENVVSYMISEYQAGRTPNPDVMCNRHVKFGIFLKKALEMGADYIATGHYVRTNLGVEPLSSFGCLTSNLVLSQAKDKNKDQSYFLWTLTQNQLKYCMFPLGDLLKPEVRKIAEKNGLITAKKKDSQGVCFIGEFNMADFLKRYISPRKGDIVNVDGEKIGSHNGVWFYTIGQRHGFKDLVRKKGEESRPFFVVGKNIKDNILVVADEFEEKKFYKKEVEITDVNCISGCSFERLIFDGKRAKEDERIASLNRWKNWICRIFNPYPYKARVRYRQVLQKCRIEFEYSKNAEDSGKVEGGGNKIKIIFKNSQRAVSSGQSLVLYKGEEMLGGGIIV